MNLRNIGLASLLSLGLSGCACFETNNNYTSQGRCVVGQGVKGLSYVPRIPSNAYGFVADGIYDLGDKIEGKKDKVEVPQQDYREVAPPPPE